MGDYDTMASNMSNEIKKVEIEGYPNYLIYSDGRVWSINRDKFLTPIQRSKGQGLTYQSVRLYSNGIGIDKSIHRLVAHAFIPNTNSKAQVNHIDGDPTNNDLSNLEWATASENIKHAFESNLKVIHNKGKTGKDSPRSRPVSQICLTTGNIIRDYVSLTEAGKVLDLHPQNIMKVCKGQGVSVGGYGWRYANSPI